MHSISAFGRLAGLTPSALRFYDDCGVLKPARVEPATGYRYYAPEQEHRAVLLRKLRAAGVPLAEVAVVLDGQPADARRVLDAHAARLSADVQAAHAALDDVVRALSGDDRTEVRLDGAELASAVRQVTPSAAVGGPYPELCAVLVELGAAEVRLVATDRYRLAVRDLTPLAVHGRSRAVLIPAPALLAAASWTVLHPEVTVLTDGREARITAGRESRVLPALDGEFPAYRDMLAALEPPRHRVIVGRQALRDVLAAASGRAVLSAADGEFAVGDVILPGVCTPSDDSLRIAFDPDVLGATLEASVGPDVLLEIVRADQPVLVRSADQGGFSTLVMPVSTRAR